METKTHHGETGLMQESSMTDLRELGAGASLAEVYTLEQWQGSDGDSAFFAASLADGERVLIKLVPASAPDADRHFATWQRARHLRHAHLLDLRDVDSAELRGASYLYAAFEYPDDTLASAIEHGPLSEPETREIVEVTVDALRYLHSQGLVHGALDPRHIVAVGNTIKLATDGLRESDDLEGHAEDVRQMGELVKRLLAPNEIGEPLRTIVEHASEPDSRNRWTLAEIATAMRAVPAAVPEVVAAPEPLPEPAVERALEPAVEPAVEPAQVATAAPLLPPPVRRRPAIERASPMGFPKWIFVGLAGVLFLILALNLRQGPAGPRTPVSTTMVAERVAPIEPPRAAAPPPVSKPSPLAPKAASIPGKAMWRVIAFTYGSHDAASKKARQLNDRWPDLHAAVFSPKERRGFYLVALGGRMKRDDALRLQKHARSVGLPRDIYVQNYSE
jgi:hypothetical protein